jgi:hypothetical protein
MNKNKREGLNYENVKFFKNASIARPIKVTEEVKDKKPRGRPKKST